MKTLNRNLAILFSGLAVTGGATILGYETGKSDAENYRSLAAEQKSCASYLGREVVKGYVEHECLRPMYGAYQTDVQHTKLEDYLPTRREMLADADESYRRAELAPRERAALGAESGLWIWGMGLFMAHMIIKYRRESLADKKKAS